MTMIAALNIGVALPFLLLLACPLMMVFMMRGMHGGHSHAGEERKTTARPRSHLPLDELKAERDALNEEIGKRAEESTRHVSRPDQDTLVGYPC